MRWGDASTLGSLCVLAASILWGTTGTVAAQVPGVGSLAVGAAAMGVGGLLQGAAAAGPVRRHRAGLIERWRIVALSAAAVAIYPLAFYTSMRMAGVAVGTVVSIGSAPMAAALIERSVEGRPLTPRWIVGAGAGLLGIVALAVARTGTDDGDAHPHAVIGVALGLLAGATYALYAWGAARAMRRGLPSRPVMGAIFGGGGLLLMPVLLVTGGPILDSVGNFAAVAYLAVVPMLLGYVLFGWGLAAIPASTATALSLLEPVVAAVIAVIVLDERLPALGWAGMAVVLAGLLVLTAPDPTQNRLAPSGAAPIDGGTPSAPRRVGS